MSSSGSGSPHVEPLASRTYLGHLDYDATDALFRRSDIVTVPSLWPEPLGAVAFQAMAAGAAVHRLTASAGSPTPPSPGATGSTRPPATSFVRGRRRPLATLIENPKMAHRLGRQPTADP